MFSSKFFENMLIPTAAMEADDVTNEAQDGVRNAMNNTTATQDGDCPEEDLTNVDGIFDHGPSGKDNPNDQENPDEGEGNANDDPTAPGDAPTEEEVPEEGGDEGGEGEDENADPNVTGEVDENGEDGGEGEEAADPLLFAHKNRIRDNLIQLYSIFNGDIETLTASMNSIDHRPTITVVSAIINHMTNAKDYIYKTLTTDLTTLEYDELLQRYITLKRLYDICIEMLQKHFESCGNYFKKKTGHGKSRGQNRPLIPRKADIGSGAKNMREDDETKNLPRSAS